MATCSGRLPVIMQRQVLQSCTESATTSGWCLSFSSSTVWTVYEMACFLCFPLLCTETVHSAFLLAGFGVLQYIDKVVDVGVTVALWRLVKECHIFSTCLRCLLGIWTLFPRAPCSGSNLPLRVATVHGSLWANFFYFPREKWTPSSLCSSHPGNLNMISACSIWQRTKPPVPASVYVAFGRVSHICIVTVDSDFPAQFALENLYIIFTCSHMAVGGGFRRL